MSNIRVSVYDYLASLPRPTLERLYTQPATCLSVLRLLPSLSQQIIMRLIYSTSTIQITDIESWCHNSHKKELSDNLEKITKLNLITRSHSIIQINSTFQTNLHLSLAGSFGEPSDSDDKHAVDLPFLDRYASEAWEAVLHYMVGTPSQERKAGPVPTLLEKSGLMSNTEGKGGELKITNKGFQFLLQDVNIQIWAFLVQYLDMADELHMDLVDELHFFVFVGKFGTWKEL